MYFREVPPRPAQNRSQLARLKDYSPPSDMSGLELKAMLGRGTRGSGVTKTPLPRSGIAALERSDCEEYLFATELCFPGPLVNALPYCIFKSFRGRVGRPTRSQSFNRDVRNSSRGKNRNAARNPEKLWKLQPDHHEIGHNRTWFFRTGLGFAFDPGPRTKQGRNLGIYAGLHRREDRHVNYLVDLEKP